MPMPMGTTAPIRPESNLPMRMERELPFLEEK
jgi:hypothetical protein